MFIKVSAVVCTCNRGANLGDTILSLQKQDCDPRLYEVIIVDNNSTDNTKEVVEKFIKNSSVRMKYVFEENIGLSNARNAGIKNSEGEIIAFIDDDAVAREDWISGIIRAFESADFDCIGGDIEGDWHGNKPAWLTERLEGSLGVHFYGGKKKELKYPGEYPCGVNMAFKRKVFDKVGLFSAEFGRKGKSLLSREETELCYRVEKSGGKVGYFPGVVVKHVIVPDKLNKKWFRTRFYWEGKSQALMEFKHFDGKEFRDKTLYRIKISPVRVFNIIKTKLTGNNADAFLEECVFLKDVGFVSMAVKQYVATLLMRKKSKV
jgi:glycosyltransferase involved in cell wall biosynthesis